MCLNVTETSLNSARFVGNVSTLKDASETIWSRCIREPLHTLHLLSVDIETLDVVIYALTDCWQGCPAFYMFSFCCFFISEM